MQPFGARIWVEAKTSSLQGKRFRTSLNQSDRNLSSTPALIIPPLQPQFGFVLLGLSLSQFSPGKPNPLLGPLAADCMMLKLAGCDGERGNSHGFKAGKDGERTMKHHPNYQRQIFR